MAEHRSAGNLFKAVQQTGQLGASTGKSDSEELIIGEHM